MNVVTEGNGIDISVRITKREGPAFHIVPEGTPGASTVAVRRVNELDFYNLGANQLAERVDLTVPKLLAAVSHLGIQDDPDCFKEITIGSAHHKRYSQRAIARIRECLTSESIDEIWKNRPESIRKQSKASSTSSNNVNKAWL